MSMNSAANNEVPAVIKPISLPSVNDKTLQLKLTEYPAPTGAGNTQYEFYLLSAGSTEILYFRLVDNGTIFLIVGPTSGANIYSGTWTPNNGTHTIHITISAGGVPTMYIDGILTPLAFIFNSPSGAPLPANTASMFFGSGPVFPDSAIVIDYFLASGVLPPTTEFCCA